MASSLTAHQHAFAESFYIVEGTLTVEVNGKTRRIGAGSYVFVPGGVRHAISNQESTRVRNILTTTPAGLERMFRRRAEELRQRNVAR